MALVSFGCHRQGNQKLINNHLSLYLTARVFLANVLHEQPHIILVVRYLHILITYLIKNSSKVFILLQKKKSLVFFSFLVSFTFFPIICSDHSKGKG